MTDWTMGPDETPLKFETEWGEIIGCVGYVRRTWDNQTLRDIYVGGEDSVQRLYMGYEPNESSLCSHLILLNLMGERTTLKLNGQTVILAAPPQSELKRIRWPCEDDESFL